MRKMIKTFCQVLLIALMISLSSDAQEQDLPDDIPQLKVMIIRNESMLWRLSEKNRQLNELLKKTIQTVQNHGSEDLKKKLGSLGFVFSDQAIDKSVKEPNLTEVQ